MSVAQAGAFEGRHCVVTGGTGALGRGVVEALLAAGATCHVPNVDPRLSADFPFADHERVRLVEGVDLTDERQVADFYAPIPRLWASIHVVGGFAMGGIADTGAAELRRMFDLNALTALLSCRHAVAAMRRADPPIRGRIVNVAARPALSPVGGMLAYAMSKAAVVSLTQSLAEELRAEGIWVNAIAPSTMDTPDNRKAMPKANPARWPKVEEVARAIAFLASPDNALTTGLVMPVYGNA